MKPFIVKKLAQLCLQIINLVLTSSLARTFKV